MARPGQQVPSAHLVHYLVYAMDALLEQLGHHSQLPIASSGQQLLNVTLLQQCQLGSCLGGSLVVVVAANRRRYRPSPRMRFLPSTNARAPFKVLNCKRVQAKSL